ncbi:putative polysaccharide ABC transporter ATP binding subunit [Scytonema sp. HK-05]|uniref:ABC transporter ATP-binding protein n=1 Tax=Scytonema sp. HK-05 TaxID=1137095 RepID=UPI0009378E1C|nr:ABC transporter ATP-binding protein [Scytonema sp. HK-05]OKH60934.1 ABC transporter ATP-binding protein [Scytonema sp. HK-05]BAY46300.1 putative polysaccharide ABC transporter ATP binding subunit [Scytonema sp. HK-05]
MSDTVIRVENLGKKYIIGHQQQERYTALRDVITNGAKSLLTTLNPLTQNSKNQAKNFREEFWALKDVSFEIKQGDRVGIIGRNGAGKSTLLKILSRITEPTTGQIGIKGRVASLLEVGTGFHPELTGRENIYLNGAILGMSKAEIKKKFDEIVDFAEVEKFLDTPVKRYSSGMYVRLAFAVAAHLEPEILIVDEVLAVGDAQFQNKCLGKIEEVGKDGRTVLFVSHNMATINSLCEKVIWLSNGSVRMEGRTEQITNQYLIQGSDRSGEVVISHDSSKKIFWFQRLSLLDCKGNITSVFDVKKPIIIQLEYYASQSIDLEIALDIRSSSGVIIFSLLRSVSINSELTAGNHIAQIELPALFLVPRMYSIDIAAYKEHTGFFSYHQSIAVFEIEETGTYLARYQGSDCGFFFVNFPWQERNSLEC